MTITIASTPYQTFAKVITSYHDQYSEAGPSSSSASSSSQLDSPMRFDAVLDEEGGLIRAFMSSLEQTIKSKAPTGSSWETNEEQISPEEHQALLSEHRTWQLLRAVYENRLHRSDPDFRPASVQDQIGENPYASPEEVIQTMVNEDDELSLYAILVDHLQTRPFLTTSPPLESRHGYLPSTLRRAKAAKSTGATTSNTPSSLDPDFNVRDPHGQGLAGEDQTYQAPFLETLWDLVRHGELDQAIKVCEQGGEPWRGASLMGGRRWTMGGMTQDSIAITPLEGNRRRALWKKSCRAIAKNPTLSAPERHLYAALISDLPTLLPACQTWEDHLWAHVQHRLENRIEQRWHDLGGFWEDETRFLGKDDEDVQIAQGGLDEVFASMAGLQKAGVANGMSDAYQVAQRMIILGRTDSLFNQFVSQLSQWEEVVSSQHLGQLVRFFAHLVLVLRTLRQPVPDAAANAIIEAYLTILEREGNDQLVAMYAACLREGNGEESYARFLRAMDSSATKEAKMEALNRAKQYNLDVAAIAKETVKMILSDAFAEIPSLSYGEPDITAVTVGLSERDVYLIQSIEWLTLMPETMGEALIKSNDVARYFLALGQANAAQSLLKTLPPGLLEYLHASLAALTSTTSSDVDTDADSENHLLEHTSFQRLFTLFNTFDTIDHIHSRQPKVTATKMEVHNWKKGLLGAVEKSWESAVGLLEGDWLRFRVRSREENGAQRRSELSLIRRTFIPSLVLQLHKMLTTHAITFPQLYQKAMDLVKIVADEENHVYEEFLPRLSSADLRVIQMQGEAGAGAGAGAGRLTVYLDKVREVGLEVLRSGSGSAFALKT